jgi:lipoprotein-anchoring transpeptidase ErfK/SrfK
MAMGANYYSRTAKADNQGTKVSSNYSARLPQRIATREKTIVVDPNVHAWGAYDASGNLVRAGLATAGGNWCGDIKRPCRTKAGSFRVASLGNAGCKSTLYPLGKGGAPMPYCMFFNKNQGLHGSPYVMEGNVSHGCVRMRVDDAAWVRYNFANVGTKVIVRAY